MINGCLVINYKVKENKITNLWLGVPAFHFLKCLGTSSCTDHIWDIDIGLIGVFFVLFPAIVTVLLTIAGAGVYVEKQQNDAYLEEHRIPGSDR